MKKKIRLILVLCLCFLLTGCNAFLKTTNCSSVSDQTVNGYKITTNYNIYSRWKNVKRVEITQIIESSDDQILKKFESNLKKQYKSYNAMYNGYKYKFSRKNGKLNVYLTINYEDFQMKKFLKDNEAMKKYVNQKNELTLDGAVSMYKASGVICK